MVKVTKGVRGFLPITELGEIKKKELYEGQTIKGKIILLDVEQRKLWISEKAYLRENDY